MKSSLFARLSLSCAAAIILVGCNDGPSEIKVKPSTPVVEAVVAGGFETLFDQRKSDLADLAAALEQHYNITGNYPETENGNWASVFHTSTLPKTAWIPGLVPNYIPETPVDPQSGMEPTSPQYMYKSNGSGYKLVAHKTGDCDQLSKGDPAKADPKRSGGGVCWAWGYFTPDYTNL
jgi:hypothetical protein